MRKKNGKKEVADRDWWTLVRVVIQRVSICDRCLKQISGIGEGFVINTFRIWGTVLRPVGEGEGPKIWKVSVTRPSPPLNASSIFHAVSFWLFALLHIVSKIRMDLLRHLNLNAISWQWNGFPKAQGRHWQTRWGHLYWRGVKKRWWKTNPKDEIKNYTFQTSEGPVTGCTVPSEIRKVQWEIKHLRDLKI